MYILRASDPDKAQPADKAVDGREEVGWLVDRIQKSRKLVAYTVSHDLRTNICRRQKYEEQKADESRHQVCTHKPKDSVRIVTDETIDLMPAVIDAIYLEIPLQATEAEPEDYPSGEGWRIMSEEDYEKSRKERIDPRLAKLREFKQD